MATAVTVDNNELILAVVTVGNVLEGFWRSTASGELNQTGTTPAVGTVYAADSPPFRSLHQIATRDGRVIEFGEVHGAAIDRITVTDKGNTVDAKYVPWSADPTIKIFWVERFGQPMPSESVVEPGRTVPLAPELYPLLTAYTGPNVVATGRIRSPGGAPR